MSSVRSALGDYLRIRRRLGFKLEDDGRLLENFVGFLEHADAEHLTSELALAWAKLPVGAHPHRWRQRLGIVRGFARYLHTIDPDSEIPSVDLLSAQRRRVTPYLYSPAEIAALMDAARGLSPALRAATYETLIGLLAVSGMRIGEALALDRADVDLGDGVIVVRHAKLDRQREVPLHDTTTGALDDYGRLRDRHFPEPTTRAFFISTRGARLNRGTVNATFVTLIRQAGLEGRGERARPRPHDLRHTFAVRSLLECYRAGTDVDTQLPLLATLLGHVNPTDTYWYLQAVPELLTHAGRRLDGMRSERS